MKKQFGFTLIELLVTTTIIIVLMTIGLVSYRQASRSSRNAKRKSDLESVRQALVLYRNDTDEYPDSASFDLMLIAISEYISFNSLTDPKSPTYDYYYSSDGAVFTLRADIELSSGSEYYYIYNP
ncbi:MAG: type II secretion system protein [Candidatus Pacebacteria bacterium]|jgi:prepilin-type N-terminal cleavage/methylation domain-containing protein|nr:type II secretion system protein [Candidatus Paceibacterota bacterium]MBT3511931.1 type II secretion system protein [Candidatus Paceibacterota bacterium]MBT4005253.1 type II secretion system protein [Candidatus Paceibacterota bacterium]MBT4358973.1 type II secretion system protein [Candidatus Paceibacterota bacterium]MBT4680462.1 type II secretion system protein [Candidatus Paceibacterota bacterium]